VQVAETGHPGWIPTAEEGLAMTLEIANQKGIKIIVNGGGLNPKGLALKTLALVCSPS
jgi:FAD/FMN-containing dehydrogenase